MPAAHALALDEAGIRQTIRAVTHFTTYQDRDKALATSIQPYLGISAATSAVISYLRQASASPALPIALTRWSRLCAAGFAAHPAWYSSAAAKAGIPEQHVQDFDFTVFQWTWAALSVQASEAWPAPLLSQVHDELMSWATQRCAAGHLLQLLTQKIAGITSHMLKALCTDMRDADTCSVTCPLAVSAAIPASAWQVWDECRSALTLHCAAVHTVLARGQRSAWIELFRLAKSIQVVKVSELQGLHRAVAGIWATPMSQLLGPPVPGNPCVSLLSTALPDVLGSMEATPLPLLAACSAYVSIAASAGTAGLSMWQIGSQCSAVVMPPWIRLSPALAQRLLQPGAQLHGRFTLRLPGQPVEHCQHPGAQLLCEFARACATQWTSICRSGLRSGGALNVLRLLRIALAQAWLSVKAGWSLLRYAATELAQEAHGAPGSTLNAVACSSFGLWCWSNSPLTVSVLPSLPQALASLASNVAVGTKAAAEECLAVFTTLTSAMQSALSSTDPELVDNAADFMTELQPALHGALLVLDPTCRDILTSPIDEATWPSWAGRWLTHSTAALAAADESLRADFESSAWASTTLQFHDALVPAHVGLEAAAGAVTQAPTLDAALAKRGLHSPDDLASATHQLTTTVQAAVARRSVTHAAWPLPAERISDEPQDAPAVLLGPVHAAHSASSEIVPTSSTTQSSAVLSVAGYRAADAMVMHTPSGAVVPTARTDEQVHEDPQLPYPPIHCRELVVWLNHESDWKRSFSAWKGAARVVRLLASRAESSHEVHDAAVSLLRAGFSCHNRFNQPRWSQHRKALLVAVTVASPVLAARFITKMPFVEDQALGTRLLALTVLGQAAEELAIGPVQRAGQAAHSTPNRFAAVAGEFIFPCLRRVADPDAPAGQIQRADFFGPLLFTLALMLRYALAAPNVSLLGQEAMEFVLACSQMPKLQGMVSVSRATLACMHSALLCVGEGIMHFPQLIPACQQLVALHAASSDAATRSLAQQLVPKLELLRQAAELEGGLELPRSA